MDIEYAKFTPTPVFVHRGDKGEKIINQQPELFIKAYHKFHAEVIAGADTRREDYLIRKQVFESKKCHYCDGRMRYISSYDFWGCSNYKQPGLHSTLTGKEPFINQVQGRISVNWLTIIIEELGFKGKVFAKDLYNFYKTQGLEDLRVKYGYSPTENKIENLNKTKRRSLEQEQEAFKYLKEELYYDTVLYQQCITYKLKDKAEKFCIPDFICANDHIIDIVDAKLGMLDDAKMDLYVTLVNFIITFKKDPRTVNGAHVIWDYDNFDVTQSNSKYPIIIINAPIVHG